jgi:hypothetical protein
MRAGQCALIVRTGEKTGTLRVYAKAQGLVPARLDIELEEPAKKRNKN